MRVIRLILKFIIIDLKTFYNKAINFPPFPLSGLGFKEFEL